MFKKILVALDDSDLSQGVYDRALELAQVMGAQIMLTYVLVLMDDGFADYPIGVDVFYPRLQDDVVKRHMENLNRMEKQGIERLQYLTEHAIAAGVKAEFTQAVGDPGSRLCAHAKTWEADLIVMGRRGRTGLTEWFLGSVSNYVLHHAPCSVLTVQHTNEPVPATETQVATTAIS